ncbi:MAG: Holliday junction branch migration protein RuvA [Nitrospirales bacterium]|nr:Holliday junction branch migration protein RuvA [Nitrospirales bacterium]
MIASLRGKLLSKKPDNVIIEAAGVGYGVQVPLTLLASLPEEGREVFLHIYTHVREDILQLFGFSSDDEKRIFTSLIGVSGIGPKIALSILSTIPPEKFHRVIDSEDVAVLCRVPGLGKKTAQRLILELKEKLPSLTKEKRDDVFDDTLSALVNLGYKRALAHQVLEKAYATGHRDIEALLRESLKYLTKD